MTWNEFKEIVEAAISKAGLDGGSVEVFYIDTGNYPEIGRVEANVEPPADRDQEGLPLLSVT